MCPLGRSTCSRERRTAHAGGALRSGWRELDALEERRRDLRVRQRFEPLVQPLDLDAEVSVVRLDFEDEHALVAAQTQWLVGPYPECRVHLWLVLVDKAAPERFVQRGRRMRVLPILAPGLVGAAVHLV